MNNYSGILKTKWDNIRTSLWFIPAVMLVFVVLLAFALIAIDRTYQDFISAHLPWLFSGSSNAARSVLSAIAGAVITIISIAFSLTIVAVQQASVQYTPRVLRTFTSDRGNQIVLGAYIATFLYSLLVLRSVRTSEADVAAGFVPAIAVSVALLLTVICIGLLIYYINHTVVSLQAVTIISRVHRQMIEVIDATYPDTVESSGEANTSSGVRVPTTARMEVTAPSGGFVSRIEEDDLKALDGGTSSYVVILPKVGDFVVQGEVIAYTDHADGGKKLCKEVQHAIVIETQRSITQDPLFLVRQLVDIALKTLSPGINDQTTAEYSIRYLADGLCRLAGRELNESVAYHKGNMDIYISMPSWQDFVEGAFRQVQLVAKDHVQVSLTILQMLKRIADQLQSPDRVQPLRTILRNQEWVIDQLQAPAQELDRLRTEVFAVEQSLSAVTRSA